MEARPRHAMPGATAHPAGINPRGIPGGRQRRRLAAHRDLPRALFVAAPAWVAAHSRAAFASRINLLLW